MSGLSLYTIEAALSDLLTARDELAEDPNADPAEIAAVETALGNYITQEIRKVDSIHGLLRWLKSQSEAAAAEVAELQRARGRLDRTAKRIKEMCCAVMQLADEKRLNGTAGRYLLRKGNGGLFPLQVDGWDGESWTDQAAPLPEELRMIQVTMPLDLYEHLKAHFGENMEHFSGHFGGGITVGAITPNGAAIRAALAEPCYKCNGTGGTPDVRCAACDGDGKARVPGARLLPRGEHLEAK